MADLAPKTKELFDCRESWVATLDTLAVNDPNIVVVANDSVGSSKLGGFEKKFPDRLINVGIAEQCMVGVAAGLANGGKIPFVSAASCFLTGRALEQIKADIAYAGFNVKLIGQSSGIAYGELGPTHHSIEDFAWLRPLTNLTIIAPADPWETSEAIKWAATYDGPVYIRLSRMPVPELDIQNRTFTPGKAEMVRRGKDVTLIACGTMVHVAASASDALKLEGINARVLNMATINPLDEFSILAAAKETGAIVTIEEASVRGGLGGAVAELTTANIAVPIERIGFPGFVPTGSVDYLFNKFGLTVEGITAAARRAIKRAK